MHYPHDKAECGRLSPKRPSEIFRASKTIRSVCEVLDEPRVKTIALLNSLRANHDTGLPPQPAWRLWTSWLHHDSGGDDGIRDFGRISEFHRKSSRIASTNGHSSKQSCRRHHDPYRIWRSVSPPPVRQQHRSLSGRRVWRTSPPGRQWNKLEGRMNSIRDAFPKK